MQENDSSHCRKPRLKNLRCNNLQWGNSCTETLWWHEVGCARRHVVCSYHCRMHSEAGTGSRYATTRDAVAVWASGSSSSLFLRCCSFAHNVYDKCVAHVSKR